MTTHNHITSILNIFKGRTGKRLMLFLFLIPALAIAQETKKIIILQTSDVHSRIEPMTQEGDRNYGQGGFVRRATFLQQFREEIRMYCYSTVAISLKVLLITICSRVK